MLVSSEVIIMLQKSLFSDIFYEIQVFFLFQRNEGNSDIKNHHAF